MCLGKLLAAATLVWGTALASAAELPVDVDRGPQTVQDSVQDLLAKPENQMPPFEYRFGIAGFARGEGVGNFRLPDFSYRPEHDEGRVLYRVKPYLYWHPNDWLDLHVEGQGYGYSGGSQDFNRASLYQGFAELRCPNCADNGIRVGRQELVYGSAFMLGSDSFYKGLTYDSLRLRVTLVRSVTVDLFGGWYATPWSGGLSGDLAGGYATWAVADGTAVEAYGFRDTGSAQRHSGEHRDSFGLRATARFGPVSLEAEPVWQSGRIYDGTAANESISAWGGHLDLAVDTNLAGLTNHFFAGAAYGSGSRAAANGGSSRLEFQNQCTDTSLTGDMNVVGDFSGLDVGNSHASGIQLYTLGWGIDLTRKLSFTAFGRYFLADHAPAGMSRRLGLESDFTLSWAMADNLTFNIGYDRFFTGGFFRDAAGSDSDIHYGYAMLQFDLSHQQPKGGVRSGRQ